MNESNYRFNHSLLENIAILRVIDKLPLLVLLRLEHGGEAWKRQIRAMNHFCV